MSYRCSAPAPTVISAPAEDIRLQADSLHAFSLQDPCYTTTHPEDATGAYPSNTGLHYAPSTTLAYAGFSQSDAVPEHQSPSFDHEVGLSFGGPIIEPEFEDLLTWDALANSYNVNANLHAFTLAERSASIEQGSLAPWNVDYQPMGDPNQPFPLNTAVDNSWYFGFQAPIPTVQPPAFVASAPALNVTAQRISAQPDANERLHCPLGCRATFGRPGDWRRHMRKHEAPRYRCAVIECNKTFARADKLRDHMRQGHRMMLA